MFDADGSDEVRSDVEWVRHEWNGVPALGDSQIRVREHRGRGAHVCVEGLQRPKSGEVGEEMAAVLRDLEGILHAYDLSLGNVLRCILLVADLADFALVNKAYVSFFQEGPPSRYSHCRCIDCCDMYANPLGMWTGCACRRR